MIILLLSYMYYAICIAYCLSEPEGDKKWWYKNNQVKSNNEIKLPHITKKEHSNYINLQLYQSKQYF